MISQSFARKARLAAFVLIGSTAIAQADQNLNCDAYAGAAVTQQAQNVIKRCGYTGPGWSDDYQAHRSWCQLPNVGMANLTHEDNGRTAALAQCDQKVAACDNYALSAVTQSQLNDAAQCGLIGVRWSKDFAAHRAWCMTVALEQSNAETLARLNALNACTG